MNAPPLKIGVSACFMHPDPVRPLFKGKRLLYVEESMLFWMMRNGALPVLIPQAHGSFDVDVLLQDLDGLLLQGGADVCPRSYGEEPLKEAWSGDAIRDAYETALIQACMDANKPVLGICRGSQIINVALGGTLYQDIETQNPGSLVHRNWDIYEDNHHGVTIRSGSQLEKIYQDTEELTINSIHHQAVKDVGKGLKVEAHSTVDSIVEGVWLEGGEDASLPYVLGVQWHPEFIVSDVDPYLAPDPLMKHFLSAVAKRKTIS